MRFASRDSGDLQSEARELAFRNAMEKAEQFAALSGMRISGVSSIVEQAHAMMPVMRQTLFASDIVMAEAGAATELPAGEIEISASVVIEFLMR
jgi:uncharacterized protein YggE